MSLHDRWMAHLKPSTQKRKGSYKIYNAMSKYGKENFWCELLEDDIPIEQLNEKEIYYIEKYDSYYNGYNSTKGGDGKIINNQYDIGEIIKNYNSGMSSTEIANKYDVSRTTISRILHANNIEMRDNGHKLSENMLEDIVKLAKNNTYEYVADLYGVDPKTIKRFLVKHNFRKRNPYNYRKCP